MHVELPPEDSGDEVNRMRRLICSFLAGSARAEHLGDIRNEEYDLWRALGLSSAEVNEAVYQVGEDPRDIVRHLGNTHGLPFDDWVLMAPDDEDGE